MYVGVSRLSALPSSTDAPAFPLGEESKKELSSRALPKATQAARVDSGCPLPGVGGADTRLDAWAVTWWSLESIPEQTNQTSNLQLKTHQKPALARLGPNGPKG